MKDKNGIKIIGIDHGYGNMKTANVCFPTGVVASEVEPTFQANLLVWEGRYYNVGVGHKEFAGEKDADQDFYVLTLAAMGEELALAGLREAAVYLAVGLPLTWVGQQKGAFQNYLLKNEKVAFTYKGQEYTIRIVRVDVSPQGFAAVVNNLADFGGMNLLCDIGNGTMNIMYVNDKKPDPLRCFTEKFGTHQCTLRVKEALMKEYHVEPPEELITQVLRTGTADMDEAYLSTITTAAREYTAEIFRKLREHGYDPRLMRLYVVGGGGALIRNFGDYDANRVTINDDICATAKGYERMLEMKLRRGDRQ